MRRNLGFPAFAVLAAIVAVASCSDENPAAGVGGGDDGNGPNGEVCLADDDCTTEGFICVAGTCVERDGEVCQTHEHCDIGEHCEAGACEPGNPCTQNSDCPRGFSCDEGGACVDDPREDCDDDNDCGANEVCVDGFCDAEGGGGSGGGGPLTRCLSYVPIVTVDPDDANRVRGTLQFGSAPRIGDVRAADVIITNNCQRVVEITSIGFESSTSNEFSWSTEEPLTHRIDPGDQFVVTVTYAPVDLIEDRDNQVLSITSTDTRPNALFDLVVDYKGQSVFVVTDTPGGVRPSVAAHNFGAVPVGGIGTKTLYVKNIGNGNHLLRVSALNIDAAGTPFAVTPDVGVADPPIVLQPVRTCVADGDCAAGTTCDLGAGICQNEDGTWPGVRELTVTYAPTQARPDQQRLVFVHDEGAAGQPPVDQTFEVLLVGGGGNPPALVINPPQVDFGAVENETTRSAQVRLENAGDQPLVVSNLRLRAFSSPEFSFEPANIPAIPAGGFQILTVHYAPLPPGLGADTGGVEMDSNDPLRPVAVVELAGESTDPTAFVSPTSIDFGGVSLNDPPPARTITVRNSGFGMLEVLDVRMSAGSDPSYSIPTAPIVPFQLPDGTVEMTFDVQFDPTQPGARTGAVEIETTDADNQLLVVPLAGEGRDDCFDYYLDGDLDGYGDPFAVLAACSQPPGYVGVAGDCDDSRNDVFPGGTERCDGADNDCDGTTVDGSGEGWLGQACDGADLDQCPEGVYACIAGGQVCSDGTGDNAEICNGQDDDCDGVADEGVQPVWFQDADLDGYGDPAVTTTACAQPAGHVSNGSDCNDARNDVHPGALDLCDGADNDCDAGTSDGSAEGWYGDPCDGSDTDSCQEGAFACVGAAQTCTDATADSVEVCDGADNDCDGLTDEGVTTTYYRDADADGFGDPGVSTQACSAPAGYVANAGDCNDARNATHPGAAERCNAIDDDCDAGTADGASEAWLGTACDGLDADQCTDGTNVCTGGTQVCTDDAASIAETCNGLDDDCDGTVDEGVLTTWYRDADADGYGNAAVTVLACTAPAGHVADATDCNDARNDVNPGAPEACDGADNDCNAATGDGTGEAWYGDPCDGPDADVCQEGTFVCTAAAQTCTDTGADSVEVCDGADNDCDGSIDEGVQNTYYRDADADGFGDASLPTQACSVPAGYVANSTDCDDARNATHPGAAERCNAIDDDCDGGTADGSSEAWLGTACDGADADQCADGTNVCTGGVQTCTDNAASTSETCNGLDDDCDGSIDEGVQPTWYRDADADGYGNAGLTVLACSQPAGYVADATDCNDGNGSVRPGATEVCDGLDTDCNGGTADGSGEAWINTPCDGADLDLCAEGIYQCTGGVQFCTDLSTTNGESCNGVDDDCDGSIDEGVQNTYYRDADGDSFGNAALTTLACSQPAGYVGNALDCDDAYAGSFPGAQEVCDGRNNDCNVATPDGSGEAWLGQTCDGADTDQCREGTYSCTGGAQVCSDATGNNTESCNGLDDDCNTTVDDGGAALCPPTSGVTSTSCGGALGCQITGCAGGTFNVNGSYADGCECVDDGAAAVCSSAPNLGVYAAGASGTYNGKIPAAGGVDWVYVEFPTNYDLNSHGTGAPTIQLVGATAANYTFDIHTACAAPASCTSIRQWSFVDDQSPAGAGAYSTRNVAWPTGVFVRIVRVTGGSTCENYSLQITR